MARVHDRAILAHARDVLLRRLDVVVDRHPVERVRIPRLLVGVVQHVVVAGPLLRDVPVPVAQDAHDERALRRSRVGLPVGLPHELVLAARVAEHPHDLGRAVVADLLQVLVGSREPAGRAVSHERDEVHAVLGVGAALHAAGHRHQLRFHLAGVVLAREVQVDAVRGHQAALRRVDAAVRVEEPHLRVPGPDDHAHVRALAGGRRRRQRQLRDRVHRGLRRVGQNGHRCRLGDHGLLPRRVANPRSDAEEGSDSDQDRNQNDRTFLHALHRGHDLFLLA